MQLEGFRDYFKVHSSRSIAGRPASDRQGETVMIIALLLPSIWLRRTANVSPSVEVIPPERIIQNRGALRDDEKLSRGESKIKPASRADVTPAWSYEASRCSCLAVTPPTPAGKKKKASSHFKHILTQTQTLNMQLGVTWGWVLACGKSIPRNQNHPLEDPLTGRDLSERPSL